MAGPNFVEGRIFLQELIIPGLHRVVGQVVLHIAGHQLPLEDLVLDLGHGAADLGFLVVALFAGFVGHQPDGNHVLQDQIEQKLHGVLLRLGTQLLAPVHNVRHENFITVHDGDHRIIGGFRGRGQLRQRQPGGESRDSRSESQFAHYSILRC